MRIAESILDSQRTRVLVLQGTMTNSTQKKTSCGAKVGPTTNPVPVSPASRGFSELTKNVIRSSHGHSTPSLKISCKSVQPFSRNLANKEATKETNKQTKKQRNQSKTIPRPPMYQGRGNKQTSAFNLRLQFGI